MKRGQAFAKVNLALVVGPLRNDGKHEVMTVMQTIDFAPHEVPGSPGREPRAAGTPGRPL